MLTMMRPVKIMVVLMLVCRLFTSVCESETITSYSGRYAADLEQKQMLLESIKEDAGAAESALRQESEKTAASTAQDISRLGAEKINLAEIMPPSGRIHVAFVNMNGTLSPKTGEDRLSQNQDKSRK